MKYRETLSKLIINGEKTTSRRLFDDKGLSQGDIVEFRVRESSQPFAIAKLNKVRTKTFKELSNSERDGHEDFSSEKEMYNTYSLYYKQTVDENTEIKIVNFEIIELL